MDGGRRRGNRARFFFFFFFFRDASAPGRIGSIDDGDVPVDDAVEVDAVVEAGLAQVDEVGGGDGELVHEDLGGEGGLASANRGEGGRGREDRSAREDRAFARANRRDRDAADASEGEGEGEGEARRARTVSPPIRTSNVATGLGMVRVVRSGVTRESREGEGADESDGVGWTSGGGADDEFDRVDSSEESDARGGVPKSHDVSLPNPRGAALPPAEPSMPAAASGESAPLVGVAAPSRARAEGAPTPLEALTAERVFLAPVEDSEHSERAVAWAVEHLLRPGGAEVLHLLVVVPAMHPSSAMAYGGPMVWLEDVSVFVRATPTSTFPPATRRNPGTASAAPREHDFLFFQ
jgi:hypothetical protein